MKRDYFEILTLLASGKDEKMCDLFLMYKAYTNKGYESFKHAVYKVVLYGLVCRENMSTPLFVGDTKLRLTKKGFESLDTYECLFYKGTIEGKFIDSDFLGI